MPEVQRCQVNGCSRRYKFSDRVAVLTVLQVKDLVARRALQLGGESGVRNGHGGRAQMYPKAAAPQLMADNDFTKRNLGQAFSLGSPAKTSKHTSVSGRSKNKKSSMTPQVKQLCMLSILLKQDVLADSQSCPNQHSWHHHSVPSMRLLYSTNRDFCITVRSAATPLEWNCAIWCAPPTSHWTQN